MPGLEAGEWVDRPDGTRSREVFMNLTLTHPMGPKNSSITETQTLRAETVPGEVYFVDVDTVNGGIPYADSFSVVLHFCISKVSGSAVFNTHFPLHFFRSSSRFLKESRG